MDKELGRFVEPGRPINQRRFLGVFDVEGNTVRIFDSCSYSGNQQCPFITYPVVDIVARETKSEV